MKKLTQLKINKLPVVVTKQDDGLFVVESPVLDIVTQGKELGEAKKRFGELVLIFFEEIVEMGTTDEVLNSLGWIKHRSNWQPPVLIESGLQEVNIPVMGDYAEARGS